MTETDKLRIRPLDSFSDYSLWRIRILAEISAKGLEVVFKNKDKSNAEPTASYFSPTTTEVSRAIEEQCLQASNIIVAALGDEALRVVRSVIGNPSNMMEKLSDRYDSKGMVNRISKVSELVSVRYTSLREDIGKHIDRMAALIEQLQTMGSTFDECLGIGILVASIDVREMMPVITAIKTLSDREISWEEVCYRLREEVKNLTSSGGSNRSDAITTPCGICGKVNHKTNKCFLNPLNPYNRLHMSRANHFSCS